MQAFLLTVKILELLQTPVAVKADVTALVGQSSQNGKGPVSYPCVAYVRYS